MFPINELRHAQKYPFSPVAKRIVEESGFTLDNVSEPIVMRAKSMVAAAFSEHGYRPRIETSVELLRNEVLAFPVAKIIVSIINRLELYRKFSRMFSNSVFTYLEHEKDDVIFDTASELGLKFTLPESGHYFAEMNLEDYLKPEHEEAYLKLVNREIERGKVFLSRIDFVRLVSIVAGQNLRNSLPVQLKNIPNSFASAAKEAESEFTSNIRKAFSKTDFGSVEPESFPPCMSKIYSDLMSGRNVNHMARFAIATFLNSIGMPPEKIVDMYRQTPNFNEKVTRYQVQRLVGVKGKSYKSPSCDKMRSYNICVANCPVSHPVQFYSREKFRQGSAADVPDENFPADEAPN